MTDGFVYLARVEDTALFAASAWALDEGRAVADALRVLFS